ncbi:hypothetical protein F4804DRAFT_300500 [Jackrogersella minutella]|nr:hypothetical protein F4804DRAFT_300500 [Jackrogersella minutella]
MAVLGFAVPSKKTLVLSIAPVLLSAYLIYRFSPPGIRGTPPPPKTRPRSESESPSKAGPAWGSKGKKLTDDEEDDGYYDDMKSIISDGEDHEPTEEGPDNRRPYDYYCMFRPFFDIEDENADKDEADQVDEDDLLAQYNQYIRAEDNIEMKPAADHPEHRWIAMWETWKLFSAWERRTSYTNPDFFKMHITKHFHGLGMQEQVENMLIAFDKRFEKKRRTKKDIRQMWATVAAIMQWLLEIPLYPWIMVGDRKKFEATVGLIGRALVSALNELDRAKMLKADSEVKDIGLVISFYLYWTNTLPDQGAEWPFRKEAVAYAKKAGIDLKEAGCYGTEEKVKTLEKEFGKIKPLSANPKSDKWDWKKKFKKFSKENKIGGDKYNILKMTRKERASFALDKKDPLADVPDKAIEEGIVRVRPR